MFSTIAQNRQNSTIELTLIVCVCVCVCVEGGGDRNRDRDKDCGHTVRLVLGVLFSKSRMLCAVELLSVIIESIAYEKQLVELTFSGHRNDSFRDGMFVVFLHNSILIIISKYIVLIKKLLQGWCLG